MPSVKNTAVLAVLATATTVLANGGWSDDYEEALIARGRMGGMGGGHRRHRQQAQPQQAPAPSVEQRSFDDEEDLYVRDFDDEYMNDLYTRDVVESYLTARENLEELLYIRAATKPAASNKTPVAKKPETNAQKQTAGNKEVKAGAKQADKAKAESAKAKSESAAGRKEAAKSKSELAASKQESATAKTEMKDGRKNLAATLNKDASRDAAASRADGRIAQQDATKAKAEGKLAAADRKGSQAKINKGVNELESGLKARDLDIDLEFLDYYYW
ncbi:MAG: hypothetical protein GOMPHAMPRED_004580 [Gomphillus americanus]|uniref:Uncharacterized protein n=1 Tax=Gomphillus americanus TaxID=1940652 RepID=A0A8H3IU67_9LECA|nr:MAG: hypothetical protein GOMPHAMPRED_004580 [Gomphillus americanus]